MKFSIDISMPRIDIGGGLCDLIWLLHKKKIMYKCPHCDVSIDPYIEECPDCKTELDWEEVRNYKKV